MIEMKQKEFLTQWIYDDLKCLYRTVGDQHCNLTYRIEQDNLSVAQLVRMREIVSKMRKLEEELWHELVLMPPR